MDLNARLKKAPKMPTGVTVEATDGRIFFLPDAEARKFEIPKSNSYRAFRYLSTHSPIQNVPHKKAKGCKGVLKWLLSHDPDSEFWRQVSVDWMNNC